MTSKQDKFKEIHMKTQYSQIVRKDKGRILKAEREKGPILYREASATLATSFSSETMLASRQWDDLNC